MQTVPSQQMTVDEFLPWAEAQERGRYELHEGEVIAVSPERAVHWKTKGAVFIALRDAIRAAALEMPCGSGRRYGEDFPGHRI